MKILFNWGMIMVMFSFFFGCSSFNGKTPPDVKLVNEIRNSTAKKLKEQKNLHLVGTGSQMMNDIEMLSMSYYYYHEVDLKTARELVLYAINEFLLEINNNKEIRSYLHKYPFSAKNVEIGIWVYNPDRSQLSPEKIYYISAIEGKIEYYIRGSDPYQALYEETYEEATKLVNSEAGV